MEGLRRLKKLLQRLGEHIDEASLISLGLILFLVASNTQTGWLYLLAGSLFGTLITAARTSRRALRPSGFQIRLPQQTQRGQLFVAQLQWDACCASYPTFWQPLPESGFRLDQKGRQQAQLSPLAGPGQEKLYLVAEQRGIYREISARLDCYGSLAWFPARREMNLILPHELVVLPPLLSNSTSPWEGPQGPQWSGNRGRPAGQGDLQRLRDYQSGDDVRWIHWPTSARLGKPMIREFSQGGSQRLEITWGTDAAALDAAPSAEAFELLMSWVHTAFARALREGWQVELLVWEGSGWVRRADCRPLALAQPQVTPFPPPPTEGVRQQIFWLGQQGPPGACCLHPLELAEGA